jgi:hypothetical protein
VKKRVRYAAEFTTLVDEGTTGDIEPGDGEYVECSFEVLAMEDSPDTSQAVEMFSIVPQFSAEQAEAFRLAVERKQHAEYVCYMMLEQLNRQLPLQRLAELAVSNGWVSDDVMKEFFNVKDAAPDDVGCCCAEGHTIKSLLALWKEATDDMLKAVSPNT